jgi:hypothetical protein
MLIPEAVRESATTRDLESLSTLPQYSECGSPPQLLKISFFFRRRIANTINFSTPTLFFCIKLILNRNTISRNTSTTFLIINSACDKVYVCNCVFQSFASAHFGHSLSPTKPPPSPIKCARSKSLDSNRYTQSWSQCSNLIRISVQTIINTLLELVVI